MTDNDALAVTDAILTPWERLVVGALWLAFAWLPSLLLWVAIGYFGVFYQPLLWLVVVGATTPAMGRILGHVDGIDALPVAPRALPHLPVELAGLVEDATALRSELRTQSLEAVLERAWRLLCEFEQLPAALGTYLDRPREALAAVRELIDMRTRPGRSRVSPKQQRARLDAALAQFEAALAEPPDIGFR